MSSSSQISYRRFGRFRIRSNVLNEARNIWAAIEDDVGIQYLGKVTRLSGRGHRRDSFDTEERVFTSLTNGEMPSTERPVGITPSGFPNVHFLSRYCNAGGTDYGVIVIEMLGPFPIAQPDSFRNLEYTALACVMLNSIQILHNSGFVHRKIQPQMFRTTVGGRPVLTDFTHSKRFIDHTTGHHFAEKREDSFHGSFFYSSVNALRMRTQSRRDDLISLGYCLIAMMRSDLPWNVPTSADSYENQRRRMIRMRENISLDNLCLGLPYGISSYMRYVTAMTYYDTPNYEYLRCCLTS